MLEGRPVYFTEVSKFNPDTRFSKMMIDRETYDKLENKNKKKDDRAKRIFDCILKYYCCYTECFRKKGDHDDDVKKNTSI